MQDKAFLSVASALYVLMLDGWRESRGVTAEIEIARQHGIPVHYLDIDAVLSEPEA